MLGLAHFKVGRAGNRRARIDQVGRVELLGAFLALVAAGALVAAIGAGALDVAIGQEAAVSVGIDLLLAHFLDQPGLGELAGEMLGELVVLGGGRAPEMVERKPEPGGQPGLHIVHLGAIFGHVLPGLGGRQFGGGAVLVGGTDKHHLVAARPHVTGVEIGGQLRAHEIAEMLDAVDIGKRGGDEDAGHVSSLAGLRPRLAQAAEQDQCPDRFRLFLGANTSGGPGGSAPRP